MKALEKGLLLPPENSCIHRLDPPDASLRPLFGQVLPAVAKLVLVHFHWQVSQILDR